MNTRRKALQIIAGSIAACASMRALANTKAKAAPEITVYYSPD